LTTDTGPTGAGCGEPEQCHPKALGSFPFVTTDIDGNPRSKPDVGAFEVGGAHRGPLTAADVGPDAP
jgi:hypothetical protein